MKKDLYVITKLVMAGSAREALEKEKKCNANEVFIDQDWRRDKIENMINGRGKTGFQHGGKN